MIDFVRAKISDLATHYVGNFGLGEDMTLTEKPYEFKDAIVKEVFFNYLFKGFDNDVFYQFRKKEVSIYDVHQSCENIFKDKNKLFEESINIANHLYRQSVHSKIKGGEVYITYVQDVIVNGELTDAIGIFKSESKETYIKVDLNHQIIDIETDLGISPDSLDKGVVIFNLDSENGYKALMVDNSSKIAEASTYWSSDFLGMEIKKTSYYFTHNTINQCVDFCETILTEENNVKEIYKDTILTNSVKFFDNNVDYVQEEFEGTVLNGVPELIESYRVHKKDYFNTYGVPEISNFTISKTAVKKSKKLTKTKIKLDKNFEILIKSRHDLIEKGYDDEKAMGFYKVYFLNESK
jgi:hypothetical protein